MVGGNPGGSILSLLVGGEEDEVSQCRSHSMKYHHFTKDLFEEILCSHIGCLVEYAFLMGYLESDDRDLLAAVTHPEHRSQIR